MAAIWHGGEDVVIYGIKQIEKQFPGFEARYCDCQLYDMRDTFYKYSITEETDALSLSNDIDENYSDLLRPPSNKMYIVIGKIKTDIDAKQFHGGISTEYAITFGSDEKLSANGLLIEEIIVSDYFHKYNRAAAKRYKRVILPQFKYKKLGSYIIGYSKDAESLKKDIFGVVPKTNNPISLDGLVHVMKDDLALFSTQIKIALFYLNIRNIKQQSKYVSQARDFYYPKTWGREYKVLSLSQNLIERSHSDITIPSGYHVRGHFARGHFKRRKTGVYWWNPHWRGDFSKGIVMKDYKVKAQ